MPDAKYSKIKVLGDVYCSSSSHHYIGVEYNVGERRWHREYSISTDYMLTSDGMYLKEFPAYFMREIYEQLINHLPTCRVYEFDSNGDERYDYDLRYHADDWTEKTIGWLKKQLGREGRE